MQGNGFLIFIASCTVLYIIGKGFGPNVGPAFNVLTGAQKTATSSSTNPAASPSTSAGGMGSVVYQPPAVPYLGVSIA